MTEFDNWALNWYDKNEKKEDLKSSIVNDINIFYLLFRYPLVK